MGGQWVTDMQLLSHTSIATQAVLITDHGGRSGVREACGPVAHLTKAISQSCSTSERRMHVLWHTHKGSGAADIGGQSRSNTIGTKKRCAFPHVL